MHKFLSVILTVLLIGIITLAVHLPKIEATNESGTKFPHNYYLMNGKCMDGFQHIVKTENGMDACVTPESFKRLVSIGWGSEIQKVPPNVPTTSIKRPIMVALWRGDVDQNQLTSMYKSYLASGDYILPILGADPQKISQLPGEKMISSGTLEGLTKKLGNIPPDTTWGLYDLEKGSGAEYNDFVNSVKTASQLVHGKGLKFALTPVVNDIKNYDKDFAPYCDMVILQIPHYAPNYVNTVQNAVNDIRSANPSAKIIIQLHMGDRTKGKVNGDPASVGIIDAWSSVKDKVDGVLVFYFADPDPTTLLKKFYDSIGFGNTG